MLNQNADGGILKGGRQRNGDSMMFESPQQNKDPLRAVLHQKTDPIAWLDSVSAKARSDLVRRLDHIRIPVLFHPVLMINGESDAVGKPVCPVFDSIEKPRIRGCFGDRRTGHFIEELHTRREQTYCIPVCMSRQKHAPC